MGDEEGKRGFKVFMWHDDVFRMVRSARLGCGVCRVLGQTVSEYRDGSFYVQMGGAMGGFAFIWKSGMGRERGRRGWRILLGR